MSLIRPITPSSVGSKMSLRNVTMANNSGKAIIGLSRDRTTWYAATLASPWKLQQWVEVEGTVTPTWTDVATFSERVMGMVEMANGEVLAATVATGSTPGYIYKSTGWATSHTTATWAKTLTTTGGYIVPVWGLHQWSIGSNGVGVVVEYGPQTTGSGDQTAKARRVYLTTDWGATWTVIFDLVTFGIALGVSNPSGVHTHAAAYDEAWDRIWVTYGDNTGDGDLISGANNAQIVYSDDRGATWTHLPQPIEQRGLGAQIQATTIACLEGAVVFGPDGSPYSWQVWPRKGYRQLGNMVHGPYFGGNTGAQGIGLGASRVEGVRSAPLLVNASSIVGKPTYLFGSADGGLTWSELWRDDVNAATAFMGFTSSTTNGNGALFGPSIFGTLLAPYNYTNGGAWSTGALWRAELAAPEPGDRMIGGIVAQDGTGAKVKFDVPHGLGVVPTRFSVRPGNAAAAAGGSFFETADATNVSITFTTAPASGTANVALNWTAGK